MNSNKALCLIISDEIPSQEPRIRNFIFAMSTKFSYKFVTPTALDDWPHIVLNKPFIWNKHHHLPTILRKPLSGLLRVFQFVRQRFVRIDAFFKARELLWTNPRQELGKIDIVFCTHPWMVPLGRRYARPNRAKLICDLFEYYPGQFPDDIQTPQQKLLVKRQLVRASGCVDRFVVASEKFVPEYQSFLNADFTYFPCAAPFHNPKSYTGPRDDIRTVSLVHHGTPNPSRKIDKMMHSIGRSTHQIKCDFFLLLPDGYSEYKEYLHGIAEQYSNVSIMKPVSPDRIIETLARYDAGLYILPPISKNQELLLPNKVFDFIQARLFMVIGPSVGFRDLVLDYNIGLVAADFSEDAIESALKALSNVDWEEARSNLDRAAEELSLEKLSAGLKADLSRLMGD